MRKAFLLCVLLLLAQSFAALRGADVLQATSLPAPAAPAEFPLPTRAQLAWQDAEVVALIHQDPRITSPLGREHYSRIHLSLADSDSIAHGFNPTKLDTDQWVLTAKSLGASVAVLVVKHELGFCLWQSDANPYCLKASTWREGHGDILRDFVESCKKYGLKPGVFTEARVDARLGFDNFKPLKGAGVTQAEFNRMLENELKELCTRYGNLFMVWYDGGAPSDSTGAGLVNIAAQYQPDMIFYHSNLRRDIHWAGNEKGMANDPCWSTVENLQGPFRGGVGASATGRFWCPSMADTSLHSGQWFWSRNPRGIKSLKILKECYLNSVGRNATLVIGLLPNQDYEIPLPDATRCAEFGRWIKDTFGTPLAKASGSGATLTLDIPAPTDRTNRKPAYIVLQEDLRQGERVRAYRLEREENGRWITCFEGQNIGYKRIVPLIGGVDIRRYRLHVTQSRDVPQILVFAAY